MNAERLLEAFNRLGDEPETVQQFRKLVVGFAASGKLVAPDEAAIDPVSLFKQIEAKKVLLIQQGVLRKSPHWRPCLTKICLKVSATRRISSVWAVLLG